MPFIIYALRADVGCNAADGGVSTFPKRIALCEGIPRRSWMTKCVTLKNEADKIVAKGIRHNVNLDLIIDTDN